MAKTIDMIGVRVGNLEVIEKAHSNNGVFWTCRCDCGKIVTIKGSKLRGANPVRSCGCQRTQKLIDYNKQYNVNDLTNQQFGLLTAKYPTEERSWGSIIWICECECGNTTKVSCGDLKSGNTRSCGCHRYKSHGENVIKKLLQNNDISFQQEYSFKDCVFPDTGYNARFDFYVNNEYIIEFDGIQHFEMGQGHFDNPLKFQKTQEHDVFKTNYCHLHHIPIIRIPYQALDKLTIQDLLLETTQYKI